MDRRTTIGTALIALAIALFVVPSLFPVQAVLTHDTRAITFDGREKLEEEGVRIVPYENLSDRGQELYVRTLENDGMYRVSPGQGAPEFDYMTGAERSQTRREKPDTRPGYVAIERPENATLPTADEPFDQEHQARDGGAESHRKTVMRYDLMEVSRGPPPLGSTPQLLRLAASLLAVLSAGIGGYLISSR
ncbi:hypothetical protein [Natrinema sp. 1APR25-10V2]|uniref:hypothetical protein n=1 Tax=Natrinema sp. 1APR25-10V2 TaxID=2951081 RepID=UPI0028761444|nr:hypothetical protein [Natrinema sp. 1APR25-10V2]MDS0474541.1 hypothetical protein [Natrinema sp. 1APR25-10V2]